MFFQSQFLQQLENYYCSMPAMIFYSIYNNHIKCEVSELFWKNWPSVQCPIWVHQPINKSLKKSNSNS